MLPSLSFSNASAPSNFTNILPPLRTGLSPITIIENTPYTFAKPCSRNCQQSFSTAISTTLSSFLTVLLCCNTSWIQLIPTQTPTNYATCRCLPTCLSPIPPPAINSSPLPECFSPLWPISTSKLSSAYVSSKLLIKPRDTKASLTPSRMATPLWSDAP